MSAPLCDRGLFHDLVGRAVRRPAVWRAPRAEAGREMRRPASDPGAPVAPRSRPQALWTTLVAAVVSPRSTPTSWMAGSGAVVPQRAAGRVIPPEMFDLVADVERYPEFVPLCQTLRCAGGAIDAPGVEVLVATWRSAIARSTRNSPAASRSIGAAEDAGRICRRAVQPSREHLEFPRRGGSRRSRSNSSSPTSSAAACSPR